MTRVLIHTDVDMTDLENQLLSFKKKNMKNRLKDHTYHIIVNCFSIRGKTQIQKFKTTVRDILQDLVPNPNDTLYTTIRGLSYEMETSLRDCLEGFGITIIFNHKERRDVQEIKKSIPNKLKGDVSALIGEYMPNIQGEVEYALLIDDCQSIIFHDNKVVTVSNGQLQFFDQDDYTLTNTIYMNNCIVAIGDLEDEFGKKELFIQEYGQIMKFITPEGKVTHEIDQDLVTIDESSQDPMCAKVNETQIVYMNIEGLYIYDRLQKKVVKSKLLRDFVDENDLLVRHHMIQPIMGTTLIAFTRKNTAIIFTWDYMTGQIREEEFARGILFTGISSMNNYQLLVNADNMKTKTKVSYVWDDTRFLRDYKSQKAILAIPNGQKIRYSNERTTIDREIINLEGIPTNILYDRKRRRVVISTINFTEPTGAWTRTLSRGAYTSKVETFLQFII
jgi:hypothetical protein